MKLKERANGRKILPHAEVLEIVGRQLQQIPKKYRYVFIKELEKFSLIKRIDQKKLQIIGGNADAQLNQWNHPFE